MFRLHILSRSPSAEILNKLGVEYVLKEQPEKTPIRTGLKISDIALEYVNPELSEKELYQYQLKVFNLLDNNCNVIISSEYEKDEIDTILAYILRKNLSRVFIICPTVEHMYYYTYKVHRLIYPSRVVSLIYHVNEKEIKQKIHSIDILITHAEYFLGKALPKSRIARYLKNTELIVIPFFHMYSSREATILLLFLKLLLESIDKYPQIIISTLNFKMLDNVRNFIEKFSRKDTEIVRSETAYPSNNLIIVKKNQDMLNNIKKFLRNIIECSSNNELSVLITDYVYLAHKLHNILTENSKSILISPLLPNNENINIENTDANIIILSKFLALKILQPEICNKIKRTIYVGFPKKVKLFIHYESLKIESKHSKTETIIFPIGETRNIEEELSIGPETVYIPDINSTFCKIVAALYKLITSNVRPSLHEEELLKRYRIISKSLKLTKLGKILLKGLRRFENYINTYERIVDNTRSYDTISVKELIEKLQVGSIDDEYCAVIIEVRDDLKIIHEVTFDRLFESNISDSIKILLKEIGDNEKIVRYVIEKKLKSEVILGVKPYKKNNPCMVYIKPVKLIWELIDKDTFKKVDVNTKFRGHFSKFTYYYTVYLENLDLQIVHQAIEILLRVLRRRLGISSDEIKYKVSKARGQIIVKIWEDNIVELFTNISDLLTYAYDNSELQEKYFSQIITKVLRSIEVRDLLR